MQVLVALVSLRFVDFSATAFVLSLQDGATQQAETTGTAAEEEETIAKKSIPRVPPCAPKDASWSKATDKSL